MTTPPTYAEIIRDAEKEIAPFQLSGWVGAVVARDGQIWLAVRRPDGEETAQTGPLSTVLRHHTAALRQTGNRCISF